MALSEISKDIKLNFDNIPENKQTAYKDEAGEYIVSEIKRSLAQGKSPVEGLKKFKILSKDYADDEKGGNRQPNLNLDGDMIASIDFKKTDTGIRVGIFDSNEVDKADGHNNFSGKSKLPQRRFIPDESQTFDDKIMNEVKSMANEFKEVEKSDSFTSDLLEQALKSQATSTATTVAVSDLFSDDFLDSFLLGNI